MVFSTIVITTALKGALGLVGTGLWLVPLLIAALSYYQYDQLDPESRPIDRYPLNPEYDFIVIGGGSAGAVVANRLSFMMNHEIGTVKMGPKTDPYAVVDSRLRVYGIKNLRVVDASIMPTIPIGHVNAGIFMIGEKAADMIKQDWSRDATGNN